MALSTRTQIKQKIKKEKRMDSLIGREDTLTAIEGVGYQTASDVNALIAQYLIDNPVGVDVIKSIQRGSVTIPNPDTQVTVTITAVDPLKSFLVMSYTHATTVAAGISRGNITNATTLTFNSGFNAGGSAVIEWQVIEYN